MKIVDGLLGAACWTLEKIDDFWTDFGGLVKILLVSLLGTVVIVAFCVAVAKHIPPSEQSINAQREHTKYLELLEKQNELLERLLQK